MLATLRRRTAPWDMVIIGGGATGLGVAVDAASRGFDVVLCEAYDFAKGTSSRSTKLIHGGVRYLQQGNVSLVMEALRERGLLLQNAPHLVEDLAFVVPSYHWWESPFYGVGLKVYDLLAGKYGFGKSSHLSKEEVIEAIPSINPEGLHGGTRYFDGQFDDSRLALNLAQTASEQDALTINYLQVEQFIRNKAGEILGVRALDTIANDTYEIRAKVCINATGPFSDTIRKLDRPEAANIIAPSQGVHLVLDRDFLPRETAIMVPHTSDGRVLFAIPWHSMTVIGTTDTPISQVELEPQALPEEVEFILETANRYLARAASPEDIKSIFTGIRPLVKATEHVATSSLSREHSIIIDPISGLLTAAGGKWTTYRKMAEDIVDQASLLADLKKRPCVTENLPLHGHTLYSEQHGDLRFYGSDAEGVLALEEEASQLAESLGIHLPFHKDLPLSASQVLFACRKEMAQTVEDVLARRSRCLFVNAKASLEIARDVAQIMSSELKKDERWQEDQVGSFNRVAQSYLLS